MRALLAGKVAEDELDAKAQTLLDAAVRQALRGGRVGRGPGARALDARERERYVRLAAAHRRARHIVLVEAGKDSVAEEDRAPLTELRNRAGRRRARPGGLHDVAAPRRAQRSRSSRRSSSRRRRRTTNALSHIHAWNAWTFIVVSRQLLQLAG